MKRAAVLFSTLAMISIAALAGWWKLGGFYTVTVINIFNLQSRLPSTINNGFEPEEGFGGAAILSAAIKKLKNSYPNAMVTESGDLVMGPWWGIWQGEPEFKIAGLMGVDAGMLGNHEFSLGQQHLKKSLKYCDFPIIASNITFDDQELAARVDEEIILMAPDGVKIGLFSLVPSSLITKIKAGDGLYIDHELAVIADKTVKKLKAKGAQAVVLLTHCSLTEDLALAGKVEGISLIISGGSDYSGNYSGEAQMRWVRGPGGWLTAVAAGGDKDNRSVSAFTLTLHRGRPIEETAETKTVKFNSDLAPDFYVEALVESYINRMDELLHRRIGYLATPLDARRESVRSRPTPIGNFIADAYRWKTGADIAVINAGGIRGDRIFPAGPITMATVMEILPFQNHLMVKDMSGKDVRQMLEFSASALIGQDDIFNDDNRISHSGFLIFSGLNASFDLGPPSKPLLVNKNGNILYPGNRVKFAETTIGGSISELNDNKIYTVAMPDFIGNGGDKYNFIETLATKKISYLDYETVIEYLASKNKPLNIDADERLVFVYD